MLQEMLEFFGIDVSFYVICGYLLVGAIVILRTVQLLGRISF